MSATETPRRRGRLLIFASRRAIEQARSLVLISRLGQALSRARAVPLAA